MVIQVIRLKNNALLLFSEEAFCWNFKVFLHYTLTISEFGKRKIKNVTNKLKPFYIQ